VNASRRGRSLLAVLEQRVSTRSGVARTA